MSVESLAAVLHHSKAKGTAKLVAVGIANHDGDGGAWPTVSTLARYANVTPRNVQSSLAKLVSLGELVVERQAGGTPQLDDHERPNLYRLLVSCPPWCDRTPQHRDTRRPRQPGVAFITPPLSESSPPRVSPATPKPPTQPDPTSVGTQPQPARAEPPVPCAECSAPEQTTCELRQRRLAEDDRHSYRPVRRASS